MYKLYSMQRSGNCYKVRLALAQLDIPYDAVEVDILKGETHTPDFLAKNPNGQIPLLEIAPGKYLPESNAILWFLAEQKNGTLLGAGPGERAGVLQWLFFEQHAIVPNIGASYFWLCLVKGGRELQLHALDDWMEEGGRALAVMERHLSRNIYFANNKYTIADAALYAYTHLAPQCDFDLATFPAIRDWLARVAEQERHISMDWQQEQMNAAAE